MHCVIEESIENKYRGLILHVVEFRETIRNQYTKINLILDFDFVLKHKRAHSAGSQSLVICTGRMF